MNKKDKVAIPLIAVGLGILIGIIILLLSGKNVFALFSALIKGFSGIDLIKGNLTPNLRYPGEFLVSAMPIILTGLAIGFAYRTGLFNIGAEGQVIMGSLVACSVGILIPMPPFVGVVVCVMLAGLGGAVWGVIPGFLKVKCNISEVVTGIMLNYTALYSANYFLRALPNSDPQRTADIPVSATLYSETLSALTNNSRLHYGIIIVVIALIVYWFIIEKTSFGYSLRATGFNLEAAKYAGIKVRSRVIYSMMISGFLAGLAGGIVVLGTFGYGRIMSAMDNYGFDGIAVALVGGCNAIGILFSGLLFALLNVTQTLLQVSGIPKEIGDIISSSIVFFVAIQYAIIFILNKYRNKQKEVK